MAVTVDTKIVLALYTGTGLTLNLTNAPWLSNVVKIIRPSLGTGVNTRQSYNGAYNGATPGGAVSTLATGLIYEITSGATNNWTLPDFTRTPAGAATPTRLVASFPSGQTALAVPLTIGFADQVGTYPLPTTGTGLTAISYAKNGQAATTTVTLALNDVLTVTATTASGTPGFLTLTKQ